MKPKEETSNEISLLTCDFCLNDECHNKFGLYEQMLMCKDCTAKAHPSCMKYSTTLAKKALTYPWQCIDCKTCAVCCTATDNATLFFCDGCDKAYHMKCHDPHLIEEPEGTWMCGSCKEDDGSNISECIGHNGTPSSSNSNYSEPSSNIETTNSLSNSHTVIKLETKPNFLPTNLVDWSAQDVTNYFARIGFSDQASVFLREEIDGKSLLLLKRSDVVEGLSLKLGPAVKIYDKIAQLQNANASYSTYNCF